MSKINLDHLLTTAQVADLLKVSPATVNRYARDGKIAVAQTLDGVRGSRLYTAGAVVAYHDSTTSDEKATS